MKKQLTMADIAKIAGVGKSTVSRYFNGGYVKEETKEKIRVVIEEYNYKPNTFAQSLKAKETKIIGVVVPCLDSTVTSRVLMSLDEELRAAGYTMLIMNTAHDHNLEIENIENLQRLRVDAIILSAISMTDELKKVIESVDVPLLVLEQEYAAGVSIINNDYDAGYKMGKYVADKGHKNVLVVSVNEKDIAVGVKRRSGILDALENSNVEDVDVIESNFSHHKTYDCVKEYFKDSLKNIDAVICSTDKQAAAVMNVLEELEVSIPEEVSICGFGGYETSRLLKPRLTTIKFDSEKLGKIATETILKMIKKEEVEKLQSVDAKFIEGESVYDMN